MKSFFFICLIICELCYTQNSGEVQYVFVNKGTSYKTTGLLRFNQQKSLYTVLKPKKIAKEEITHDGSNIKIMVPDNSDTRPQFALDRDSKILSHFDIRSNKMVCLTEKIPKLKWEIINELKEIGGYTCQKATAAFRGRAYTVWFAPELALPYGPWKLQGLPGLILEVIDDKEQIYFSVQKVTLGKEVELSLPKAEETFTLEEYETIVKPERHKALLEMIKSRMKNRNTVIVDSKSGRDNALETIFEWEEGDKK